MEVENFTHTCTIPDICFYGENDERVFIAMILLKGTLVNAISTAKNTDEAKQVFADAFNVSTEDVVSCEALIEFIQQLYAVREIPFYDTTALKKRRLN